MTEENGIPTRTDLADIPEQTPEDKRKRTRLRSACGTLSTPN